jgi:hypothetical protein
MLLLLVGANLCGQSSKTEQQDYTEAANAIVGRQIQYLKNNGCWTPQNLPSGFQIKHEHDRKANSDLVLVESTQPPYSLWFALGSTQVVRLLNSALIRANQTRYLEPPKPQWDEKKAAALGAGYLASVLGPVPVNVSAPRVRLIPQRDAAKFCNSTWLVTWARTDKKGHPFERDSLVVELVDGMGPTGLGVNFWSHYEEKDFELIAETKARALAAAGAKQILGWSPGAGWLANFELVGDPTMELRIVNPNNLPDQPSIESLGGANELNARLAWVATYKKQYKGPATPDHTVPTGGDLQVWIDAENGQLLGGDFK